MMHSSISFLQVNCYNRSDTAVPFGGYRMSGVGKENGEDVLNHYTATKAVYQKLEGEQAWY
jgi:acyl-CoA reductase-like NAD-dependent aldehyde dehydrogenase